LSATWQHQHGLGVAGVSNVLSALPNDGTLLDDGTLLGVFVQYELQAFPSFICIAT
jgi:hypothetical protein